MLDAKFALENDSAEPLYAESVGDTVSIFTDTKQHVKDRHSTDGKNESPGRDAGAFHFL